MIEVSHESPISMLKASLYYNDYEYALVHLFDKYPKYLKFYLDSIKTRKLYLDNSIFELGDAFDIPKFKEWCEVFCGINEDNFYYIVPDVLEDCERTIENFVNFDFKKGHRIGVAQGSTKAETIKCFEFLRGKCDIIAISFDYSWFGTDNSLIQRALNRVSFINTLDEFGLLKNTKIHLLGCYVPQEFQFYGEYPEIVSLDTSNPVLHGLKRIAYDYNGLKTKESQKLADLIEFKGKIPPEVWFNIGVFKSFLMKGYNGHN